MKTTINPIISKPGRISRIKLLTLAAALIVPAATGLAQTYWQGPTNGSADYNTPADWVGGSVPGSGGNPADDNGSNSVILIQAGDPAWSINSIRAGWENNDSGSYIQSGSTVTTTLKVRMGAGNSGVEGSPTMNTGSAGYYTLNGGTINSGSDINIGEFGLAVLNVNGGAINSTAGGNFAVNNYQWAAGNGYNQISTVNTVTDVVNQTAGIITVTGAGQLFVGNGGPAIYNLSGGTNTVNNYIAIGRAGGNGTFNMTGGLLVQNGGGNLLVGTGFQSPSGATPSGLLNQSAGTIKCTGQFLIPEDSPATGTANLSGTAVVNVHDWVAVGRSGGAGVLNVSNGAAITRDNANDSGANFTVGSGGSGVLNQYGGAITNNAGNTYIGQGASGTWNMYGGTAILGPLEMSLTNAGGGNATLNLYGGTVQVSQILGDDNNYITTLNLDGGTLQASANNASFVSGLYQALVSSTNSVIDSQSYSVTISQPLFDNDSGLGGLTKVGTGTLALTGANNYGGTTTVQAGTLGTTTASTGGGAYLVANGAALSVQVASPGTQLAAAGITFSNSATTLDVDLNTFGSPSSAPVDVNSGNLTVNGTVTLNVLAEAALNVGQFSLITYPPSGLVGSGNSFVLGSLPAGALGYLSNNVANDSIDLVVTGVAAPAWNGTFNGNWNFTTSNWIDLVTSAGEIFQNGDPVVFNDSASGTTTVNVTTAVSPASVTVSNTALPYSFSGAGSINGATGLLKQGANSLTILNANGYTGPTVISGGSLIASNLANGGSSSAIGASSAGSAGLLLSGGTLDYVGPSVSINRGYTEENTSGTVDISVVSNLTLTGSVSDTSGSGCVVAGPGQLTYANTELNALSDVLGYNVDEGTVTFGSSGTDDISGSFDIGSSNAVASVVDITNSVTVNLLTGGDLDVADSHANGTTNYGAINQSGGVLNVPGGYQTWIGNNTNGIGIYNLSGGTFNANNWLAIGRLNGVGTFNLSGSGALHIVNGNGGNLDIGTSAGVGGAVGTGVLNQTGGTITNTASQTWLGEGTAGQPASGTWNMSGGTALLGEVHLGVGGTGTSTLNISGSASITESYLLLANYDPNTTGNVNVGSASQPGGTINVNADMNVGGAGFGTLNFVTNGGGIVTVTGTLYLSRFNATADGTVNLNAGGTLVVGFINNGWAFNEGTNSPTFNPNAFNFNGGTLRAFVGSGNFIQPNVNAVVQSGGAIIDDGGYSVSANCTFNDALGSTAGLTKLGSGTLTLTATNTYTGTTIVSNGTLVATSQAGGITVESGATLLAAGSVAGPVTVASGGTLGGNVGIGTESFNSTLSLAAGSTTFAEITPSSNDQIVGLTGVTYGGSLIVSNISASPLTVGSQFQLFSSSNPGSGNFTSVTLLPAGAATFNPSTGILTITSIGAAPVFNHPYVSSGNLVLTATGGSPGANLQLLSSTNLLTPISNWATNYNGAFDSNGNFSNAVPVTSTNPVEFFLLKTP